MFRNLMVTSQASHNLKELVWKYLLRNIFLLASADNRNECFECEILEMINQLKIPANIHENNPLLRALVIISVYLSGDESISDEKQCERVYYRVKCAKYRHGFSRGSPNYWSANYSCWCLCRYNGCCRWFVCVSDRKCHADQEYTAYGILRHISYQFPVVK